MLSLLERGAPLVVLDSLWEKNGPAFFNAIHREADFPLCGRVFVRFSKDEKVGAELADAQSVAVEVQAHLDLGGVAISVIGRCHHP